MNRVILSELAFIRTSRRVLLAGVTAVTLTVAGCASVPFAAHDAGIKGPSMVTGQVTSERGAIVAQADVTLAGPQVHRQAKTDITGRYVFEQVPLGSYTVSASAAGYKAAKQKITIEKEGTVRADLKVRM